MLLKKTKIRTIDRILKENIKLLSDNYINFIQKANIDKKSSSKNFFIIIKHDNKNNIENENIILYRTDKAKSFTDLFNYVVKHSNYDRFTSKDNLEASLLIRECFFDNVKL